MKIKICGLSRLQDITAVNQALPDFIGFVFAESRRQITPAQAAPLKAALDPRIQAVGVFVNHPPKRIAEIASQGIIDIIQLHGEEDEEYIQSLRSLTDKPIIKAVRVSTSSDILEAAKLPCDYLLLDSFHPSAKGGTGATFTWDLIGHPLKPFFLAGGLKLENLAQAATINPFALDLSSGVETNGVKDPQKIAEAVKLAKSL